MRLTRLIPAILVLILLFGLATPSSADPLTPRLDLAARAWSLFGYLVHLALPDGGFIDPLGAPSGTTTTHLGAPDGCFIDPNGRCKTTATPPPPSASPSSSRAYPPHTLAGLYLH